MFFDKNWRTWRRCRVVVNAVSEYLAPKYELHALAGKHIRDAEGLPNKKALGYLAGFTEAAMRERNLDPGPTKYSYGVLKTVFERIWGAETGNEYLECWVHNMNDPDTLAGYKLGVDDCLFVSRTGMKGFLGQLGDCWKS
jgi:hypothetical protein